MRKAVHYRGCWLMPGSHARQLYDDGKLAALERHMAQLETAYRQLHGVPSQ